MRKIYLLVLLMISVANTIRAGYTLDENNFTRDRFSPFNVIQPDNVTICSGATTNTIVFSSTVSGTTFTWTNNNTAIGLGASGTGNIAPFTAINPTAAPVTATITVTPSTGAPATFTITVTPIPNVNSIPDGIFCNNTATPIVTLSGTISGASYTWSHTDPSIGLAESGIGNIPSFTTVNSSSAPITSTYTVTPAFGTSAKPELLYYKFNGTGANAPNLAINPPSGTTTGTLNGNMFQGGNTICGGSLQTTSTTPNTTDFFNTGWAPSLSNSSWSLSFQAAGFPATGSDDYRLIGSVIGTSPIVVSYTPSIGFYLTYTVSTTGFPASMIIEGSTGPAQKTITIVYDRNANQLKGYVDGMLTTTLSTSGHSVNIVSSIFYIGGGSAPGGNSSMVSGCLLDEVRLYNRAIALPEVKGLVNSCTAGGVCIGPSQGFDNIVYPNLVVNTPASQVRCSGTNTNAVNFTGTAGATFSWVNDNTAIGLAASGTGNIPSFTATNTGTSPLIATITVTPTLPGGPVCASSSKSFIIRVNPIPTVNTITDQTVCRNTPVSAINFTGAVNGTIYTWTNSNTAIGLAASGSGNIPAFTTTNSTNAPISGTITVTPSFGNPACTGTPITFIITVYPDALVNDPADQTLCVGSPTAAINFTGTSGATFNWTNDNPSIGLASSGTGDIPAFTTLNTTTSTQVATITVTPSVTGGPGCTASAQVFTITVNPIPNVNNIASQTVCNNAAVSAINFSGSVPGANYTWTNSDPSIGIPASGSGNIPSFTAVNTSGNPVTSTITVTPTFGSAVPDILYYKFDGAGTSVPNLSSNPPAGTASATIGGAASQGSSPICGGSFIGGGSNADVLNTNWQPNHSGSWSISFRNANLSATSLSGIFNIPTSVGAVRVNGFINGSNNIIRLLGPTFPNLDIPGGVSTSSVPKTVTIVYNSATLVLDGYVDGVLVGSVTALNPVDLTNSNNLRMRIGFGESSPLTAGSFLDEFRLYGRMLSLTEIQDLATSCTPGAACTGSPEIFAITVNPSPVVNPVGSQNVCTGNNTSAINFTGNIAGATYDWTNSNPSIGLAASGTGNIPSFTAINAGNSTETAIITVTAVSPLQPACPGTLERFTISVSPVPTGTANPASQTVCSETAINPILFTGNVPGISFDWTRDNLATVTGIPGVGNGDISGTLTNTTNAPVTVTFTVTPSIGGCVGTPFTVTVTVNENLPVAIATPVTQTICSGNISDILLSSSIIGTTFNWTRDNNASVTGITASGTGDITGTLFNTTTTPVTVTFTIIPIFNGCTGAPITATVLVNAVPTIICPANIVTNNTTGVCGTTVTFNTAVTGAPAPNLTYTLSGATSGSGSGNGSGSLFNVGTTTVTVTATNICGTASCSFTVTVNDTENPTITCPASIQANTDPGICAATVVTPNPTIADNCATTMLTWTLSGATTGASATTGINFAGTRLFNKGVTTVTYTVKDAAGNTATCSYTVTVRDLENPVVICPSNITVTTPIGSCTAIVNYTVNAADNCPGVSTQQISGPASGSAFPIGSTTISWRAIDAAGNLSPICSFTVTVLDGQLPVISSQPATQTVCSGSNVTYTVTASNVVTYQWQQWNGNTWVNISGANASSFTVNNVTVANNASTYRVVLNGLCSVVNSAAASLFVNPLPVVSIRFSPLSQLLPSQNTTIESTVSPSGGTYVWRRNNNVVIGAQNEVLDGLTVDHQGTYQLTYTDLNGCVSNSGTLVLSALESPKIWVYPSPNNGRFQVRYYNSFGEPVTVRVFNSAGQLLYSRLSVTADAYSRIDVDLGNPPAGVYIVKVYDTKSRELAAKKIVVYR